MASSSRGRSSSPFSHRKPSTPYSSASTTSSSFLNGKVLPRSCSSSASSFYNGSGGGGGGGFGARSLTPNRGHTESMQGSSRGYGNRATPVPFVAPEDSLSEPVDVSKAGDSISVTIRFRPLSEREYQKGDEIAWYADGERIVRYEYSPATAYGFDRVFGPSTGSQEVYEVAARPVVKAAMEGVSGTVFAYGVTSSGKTHTMHGNQHSPGVIPQAIKDVFSMIQDTPGREFLLRVSYLEIYNEVSVAFIDSKLYKVINDLLDPTGQNLRVREDAQGTYVEGIKEEVVLSPGHALSFIAAGEEHRHVGSNNFNLFSSRSHTIFTLMIESNDHGDEYDGVVFSQLNLIDLAGSESSKTETTGLRRKEGSYINKSLLTLGTVIGKLSEGKASHVPYRDSKLTRLLQSSLSGHGHVSLICTITPASSNMEETHNTLKFASRAKRVEIYASRNKIIDEKSLIKKYQKEISTLREELDHLRKGMIGGVNHEEIMTLKQKLEEGQVKMQSRLEEEEEAKAALMSRIQRLTKLILVSSKNTIPGYLSDAPAIQSCCSPAIQSCCSIGDDDKILGQGEVSLPEESGKESPSSVSGVASEPYSDLRQRSSSSIRNSELSPAGSTITELTQGGMTMSDQVDLFAEQVKMLAGEIALSTSTLKRMVEQSGNDPDGSKVMIQKLELEIEEKRKQMRVLEQRIVDSGEGSISNASLLDMQQTVMRLMTQCNEKSFELEIKSADNRILQEQLQNKCTENIELQEKLNSLQQQLSLRAGNSSSCEQSVSQDYVDELRRKVHTQEIENEKLRIERVQFFDENSGLRVQNKKLSEEASYAKKLASTAAVELKNLASEVTKLSVQNSRLENDLSNARELAHSRVSTNGFNRKHSDSMKPVRKGRLSVRAHDISSNASDDFESWNLDNDELKTELQTRKQREAALESALAEKEMAESEYRRKCEEARKREEALENDLANMWVLVAKLKKGGGAIPESNAVERRTDGSEHGTESDTKINDIENKDPVINERQVLFDGPKLVHDIPSEEPLVLRLKAQMQEMKKKDMKHVSNVNTDSHVCKVCLESSTATILLPCCHFCLCESCSLACSECPICRTKNCR